MRYDIKARCVGCAVVKACRRMVIRQRVLDMHICAQCSAEEAGQ